VVLERLESSRTNYEPLPQEYPMFLANRPSTKKLLATFPANPKIAITSGRTCILQHASKAVRQSSLPKYGGKRVLMRRRLGIPAGCDRTFWCDMGWWDKRDRLLRFEIEMTDRNEEGRRVLGIRVTLALAPFCVQERLHRDAFFDRSPTAWLAEIYTIGGTCIYITVLSCRYVRLRTIAI
jgi:hypothetical protein